MKLRITLKDPDGIHEAISDYLEESRPSGLLNAEWEDIKSDRRAAIAHSKFIEYGDYITVEIDVEAGTAVVVPRN